MTGIQLDNYILRIDKTRVNGKVNGLVLGDILRQNQAIILGSHKGEVKERPEIGVGISDMLLDNESPLYWRTLIRESLEMDSQTVNKITITQSSIAIDSKY